MRKLIESLKLKSRVAVFVTTFFITVVLLRLGTLVYNPNPTIFNFELHHFDYGLVLLFLATVLLNFDEETERRFYYLLLTAVSFGLIIDDLVFIRNSKFVYPEIDQMIIYHSTLLPTVLISIILISTIFFVNARINKKKKK